MKWPTICVTLAILTPATVVITLVIMLSTGRLFNSEPNKFPCLFCATEDAVGDEYGPAIGHDNPNPLYHYMPPDPSLAWSPDGAHLVFTDVISPYYLHKTYILAMDDLTAQPSGRPSAGLPVDSSSVGVLLDVPARNGEHDHALAPRVSPDGSQLVYATYRHLTRDDDAWHNYKRTFEIETVNIDRSKPSRLTHDLDWNVMPAWSPDGSRIAFVKYGYLPMWTECVEDTRGLYLMDTDGSDVRMVAPFTFPQRVLHTPVWSPDGDSLAYVLAEYACGERFDNGDVQSALYTVGVDGSGLRMLARMKGIGPLSWSPDGGRIAFGVAMGDLRGVYTIHLDGDGLRQVRDRNALQVMWSPDGSKLLINGNYIVWPEERGRDHRITGLHDDIYGWGAWSPDGSHIAVYRPTLWQRGDVTEGALFEMASDGSTVRTLARYDEEKKTWHICNSTEFGISNCTPQTNNSQTP